jgi:two-component system, sensor histidine kinase LadS
MKQKFLILILLNFFTFSLLAQKVLKIPDIENPDKVLTDYIEIYTDSTNSLDVYKIISKEFIGNFVPWTEEYNKATSARYIYWVHFVIEKNNLLDTTIGLYIPLLDHIIDVYTVKDTIINIQKTGFFVNSDENDEIIRLSNIIRISGGGKLDFYCRIQNINDERPDFHLKFINVAKETLKNKRKIIIDATVQGMIWLMIIFGLFMFILNKDKLYLYYSVYSLFLALWLAGTWGFYYQIFSGFPRIVYPYQSIAGFLGVLFYIQFIRTFISTSKIFPGWDKLLRIIQVVAIIEIVRIPVFVFATNFVMTNYYIQAATSMVLEMILLVFVIKMLVSKIQFTTIIGVGSTILILSNFTGSFLWLLYNDNTWFIFQKTGSIMELIIFLLGLSYRYLLIEEKEQKYLKKLILQLKENATLQEKVTRELEQKVQERTIEIRGKNEILEQQKNEIEFQNKNLTTSIHYGQRIQSAVFPSDEILSAHFPDHFILFKPLDIVSGDFYWFKKIKNRIFIVAADCTGHGVPAAFLSLLGITFLHEIVDKDPLISANEVLTRLRYQIIETLHQSHQNTETREGMEMALCIIDLENRNLQFSGAFRPIYMISDSRLHEIPGDNIPIGIYAEEDNYFTNKEFRFKKDDVVYLFTDGYADQIGGSDRKTFKTQNFRKLLEEIHQLPMQEQKAVLEKKTEEWKGNFEQVDDILVMGIRLNEE